VYEILSIKTSVPVILLSAYDSKYSR